MCGKSKASLWRNLSTVTPQKCLSTILCFLALVYKSYFFSEQPFYGHYSTLGSHTNTIIFHTLAYSSRWRRKPWLGLYWTLLPLPSSIKRRISHVPNLIREVTALRYDVWIKSLKLNATLPNVPLNYSRKFDLSSTFDSGVAFHMCRIYRQCSNYRNPGIYTG